MNPDWLTAIGKIRAGIIPDEAALHRAVAEILTAKGVKFTHEHSFTKQARIDFLVEWEASAWGIECKVNPCGMAVWRQLECYAPGCDFLVLVTTKPVERVIAPDPRAHRCKGLHVLELWKNF